VCSGLEARVFEPGRWDDEIFPFLLVVVVFLVVKLFLVIVLFLLVGVFEFGNARDNEARVIWYGCGSKVTPACDLHYLFASSPRCWGSLLQFFV
jgi:hypothetical protein